MSFVRVVRHRKGRVFGNVEAMMVSFLGSRAMLILEKGGGGSFFLSGLFDFHSG